jgi:hypothetical protein
MEVFAKTKNLHLVEKQALRLDCWNGRWQGCVLRRVCACFFRAIEPIELVGAEQDQMNHCSQPEQENALNDHSP